MKTVQQVLAAKSGSVLSVAPTSSVYAALALMAAHDIGALVVVDGDRLAGMFSERDYARKVVLRGKSSATLTVADVMTPDVLTVTPRCTMEDCMAIMTDHHVRHLPVLGADGLVGLVSIGDVVKAMLDDQRFVIEQLEQYIVS
ncbi:MAG: CBS domain-containing protein [Vicinamibacterales bacterium]